MSTLVDGVARSADDAVFSAADRAVRYGEGVFETLRFVARRPFSLAAHVARLRAGARQLGLEAPDAALLEREVRAAVLGGAHDDGVARLLLTERARVVSAEASAPLGRHALRVTLVPSGVFPGGAYPSGVKSCNYVVSLRARELAQSRGFEDAILTGSSGELVEGAQSNVFAVFRGVVKTPPRSSGCLAGVVRAFVVRELGGVREDVLVPSECARADEVFLTSSVRGIASVVSIDGRAIGPGGAGPVAAQLASALDRAHARGEDVDADDVAPAGSVG